MENNEKNTQNETVNTEKVEDVKKTDEVKTESKSEAKDEEKTESKSEAKDEAKTESKEEKPWLSDKAKSNLKYIAKETAKAVAVVALWEGAKFAVGYFLSR